MSGDFSQTMTSSGALIRIYDPLTTVAGRERRPAAMAAQPSRAT